MPMNTTLRTSAPALRRACTSCSRISPLDRFPSSPMVPVAQKLQPILQPTCELTHSVVRGSPATRRAVLAPWRITTVSTRSPSCSSTSSLVTAPSPEVTALTTREVDSVKCCASSEPIPFGSASTPSSAAIVAPGVRSSHRTAVRAWRSLILWPRRNAWSAGSSRMGAGESVKLRRRRRGARAFFVMLLDSALRPDFGALRLSAA